MSQESRDKTTTPHEPACTPQETRRNQGRAVQTGSRATTSWQTPSMVDLLLLNTSLRSSTSTTRDRVQANPTLKNEQPPALNHVRTPCHVTIKHIARQTAKAKKAAKHAEHLNFVTCSNPKSNRRQTARSNFRHLVGFATENKPQVLHPDFEETLVVMDAEILDGKLVLTTCCL